MEFQRVGNKELNTLDDEEKLDVGWLVKYKLEDMDTAHTQRLAALATANAAALEARRAKVEKERRERHERLRAILARNPTRWAVSIEGKLVVADKKGVHLECPKCGVELSQILDDLSLAMEQCYEKFWVSDFRSGNRRPSAIASDATCACGKKSPFRIVTVPY